MSSVVESSVYEVEMVVRLRPDLISIQATSGEIVPADALGPGVVRQVRDDGELLVRWTPDIETWVRPENLAPPNPKARLISVYHVDSHGTRTWEGCKVATRVGLKNNWIVELFPEDIVRTVRADGYVWTFEWNHIFQKVYPLYTRRTQMNTEGEAEALTAAEIALK